MLEVLVVALSLALAPPSIAFRPAARRASPRLDRMPSMMVSLRPRRTPALMAATTRTDAAAGTVRILIPQPSPPKQPGLLCEAQACSRVTIAGYSRAAHNPRADPSRLPPQSGQIHTPDHGRHPVAGRGRAVQHSCRPDSSVRHWIGARPRLPQRRPLPSPAARSGASPTRPAARTSRETPVARECAGILLSRASSPRTPHNTSSLTHPAHIPPTPQADLPVDNGGLGGAPRDHAASLRHHPHRAQRRTPGHHHRHRPRPRRLPIARANALPARGRPVAPSRLPYQLRLQPVLGGPAHLGELAESEPRAGALLLLLQIVAAAGESDAHLAAAHHLPGHAAHPLVRRIPAAHGRCASPGFTATAAAP
eukprot:scaffold2773_cov123-Isochrysis_galbana.AAC.3